jgi:serpin B
VRRLAIRVAAVLAAVSPGLVAPSGSAAGAGAANAARAHGHSGSAAAGAATASFGLGLLRQLPAGNLVVSPDSIATALAMAGTGAAGQTQRQIARVLHTPPSALSAIGRLQPALIAEQSSSGGGHPPRLEIANGLFVQRGFPVTSVLLRALQGSFGAPAQAVDFKGDPAGAVRAVNGWVSEKTHGLIPTLLGPLLRSTRLLLASALYLHALWAWPFNGEETQPGVFHSAAGAETVPFMNETAELPYAAGPGYAAVSLPYAGSTLSLLVILPTGPTPAALESRLERQGLGPVVRELIPTSVDLGLPRFHLAFKQELNATLTALGMPLAFSRQAANFAGIDGGHPRLYVNLVAHAADLRVQESGTEAAAVTAIGIVEATGPSRRARFQADHPFLFFLRDGRTGAVLFEGRLADAATAQR